MSGLPESSCQQATCAAPGEDRQRGIVSTNTAVSSMLACPARNIVIGLHLQISLNGYWRFSRRSGNSR